MKTILFKLLNRKFLNQKAWNGKPYYRIVKVKSIRTALVDDYCGGRSTITPCYLIDIFTDKIIRDHYKKLFLNYLNKRF